MTGLKLKHFVLKPEGNDIYARASQLALRTYALYIRNKNPQFSKDLIEWADKEMLKSLKTKENEQK